MKTLVLSAPDEIFDNTVAALCFKAGSTETVPAEMELIAKAQLLLFLRESIRQYTQQRLRDVFQKQMETVLEQTNSKLDEVSKIIEIKIETV